MAKKKKREIKQRLPKKEQRLIDFLTLPPILIFYLIITRLQTLSIITANIFSNKEILFSQMDTTFFFILFVILLVVLVFILTIFNYNLSANAIPLKSCFKGSDIKAKKMMKKHIISCSVVIIMICLTFTAAFQSRIQSDETKVTHHKIFKESSVLFEYDNVEKVKIYLAYFSSQTGRFSFISSYKPAVDVTVGEKTYTFDFYGFNLSYDKVESFVNSFDESIIEIDTTHYDEINLNGKSKETFNRIFKIA